MVTSVLPTYARAPLEFVRGQGVWLFDSEDERYLDLGGGIAVNLLGHAHPHLVDALKAQAEKLWHTSNLYRIPGQECLARRLTDNSFADKVFFTNSGAEAVETTIKMARKHHSHAGAPERYRIITFDGAFHGRTLATIAAVGKPKLVDGFGPMPDGFDVVPFDDADAVGAAVTGETAGVLLEPIQGEGGIRPFSTATLQKIRKICDTHGILLLLDEVQCGMGRTGCLFAHELHGIQPDILATAKGLGGGFPVGACLATAHAAAGMTVGSHGSTFGGNPLAMAVGNAVLDIVLEDGFLERVRRTAGNLRQSLGALADAHPEVIGQVDGEGLMIGLKCKIPAAQVIESGYRNKLLMVGAAEETVRLLPPLNITEEEVREACAALDRTLAGAVRG